MSRDGADSDWQREHGLSGAWEDPDSYFENTELVDEFEPETCENVFFASFKDARLWAMKKTDNVFIPCPFGHGYVPKNSSVIPQRLNRKAFNFLLDNLEAYFCEPINGHDFAGVSKVPDDDFRAVFKAASAGDLPRLKQCLRASAFTYDPWSHGYMIQKNFNEALKYSAQHGHMLVSQWLAENGADSVDGLESSLISGNLEIFDWLIEHGSDIPPYAGGGALIAAQRINDYDRCKRIIERGSADFHFALRCAAADGATAFCELYLKAGAKVNEPRWWSEDLNDTPLSVAVRSGQLEVCKLLIDYGAKLKGFYPVNTDTFE